MMSESQLLVEVDAQPSGVLVRLDSEMAGLDRSWGLGSTIAGCEILKLSLLIRKEDTVSLSPISNEVEDGL
jgi:hypothetical protein